MLTQNTRFARDVFGIMLGYGCLMSGIPWLTPIALLLLYITSWFSTAPQSRTAGTRGLLPRATVLLTVLWAIGLFADAHQNGAIFARKPLKPWFLIVGTVGFGITVVRMTIAWWRTRTPNHAKQADGS